MNSSPQAALEQFTPHHGFFIGIDSDGCAFDTMEIKHKECFCPAFIQNWKLQTVSRFAREVWEFVNLYSTTRGCNRFLALLHAMDLLAARREVRSRSAVVPDLGPLRSWCTLESRLGEPALAEYAKSAGDPVITTALDWSRAVNVAISEMVYGIPPFPLVRESLEQCRSRADIMVVSQTPLEALEREWQEHGLGTLLQMICAQEHGTKTEHLRYAAVEKYAAQRILMIGDAPGDLKAARENNALFYPIIPGGEEESWQRFYYEALERFFKESYAGSYQTQILDEFSESLPETPPWDC